MPRDDSEQQLKWGVSILEQALSQLGQGIILLSSAGEIMFTTQEADRMLAQQDGLIASNKHLLASLPQDQERLQQVLTGFNEHCEDKAYKGFYIHRNNQLRPYLLYASPITLENMQGKAVMLIIKDTHADMVHWEARLTFKYHLTKREAQITMLLTEGRSASEISTVMGIAEDTTRQYLKNCFKKMDVQKQHEMVCLALDSSRRR